MSPHFQYQHLAVSNPRSGIGQRKITLNHCNLPSTTPSSELPCDLTLSSLVFVLTENFLRAERPCNLASLRTRRKVSGEIEVENFSFNSAEIFCSTQSQIFLKNLLSRLVYFVAFLTLFSVRFSSLKHFITYCTVKCDKLINLAIPRVDLPLLIWWKIINFRMLFAVFFTTTSHF